MLLTRLSSSSCSSTALQRHACTGKPLFRGAGCLKKRVKLPGLRARVAVRPPCAAPGTGGIVPAGDDDDGVSLGTVKLPGNIDIARFESLLFQWGNSLCQGANLPLPVPLRCALRWTRSREGSEWGSSLWTTARRRRWFTSIAWYLRLRTARGRYSERSGTVL
ncbi:unnamed protein product [Urochloa humidicola]